jgi:signal recognition particle receptor subunit beta
MDEALDRVLVLGLPNSGKKTLMNNFRDLEEKCTKAGPVSCTCLKAKNVSKRQNKAASQDTNSNDANLEAHAIQFVSFPIGKDRISNSSLLWERFYDNVSGVMWLVDSRKSALTDEAVEKTTGYLNELMNGRKMLNDGIEAGAPVLIIATKTDASDAVGVQAVSRRLAPFLRMGNRPMAVVAADCRNPNTELRSACKWFGREIQNFLSTTTQPIILDF